jgi:hypothetical protein
VYEVRRSEARVSAQKLSAYLFVAAMLATGLLAVSAGRADHLPYVRPDGSVVYGDWGLYRPGAVVPWVVGPAVIGAPPLSTTGYFFPTNRDDPGAYRRRPPEKSGPPGEPYSRWWGAESEPPNSTPPTVYAPFDPPPVILAPRVDGHSKHPHKHK